VTVHTLSAFGYYAFEEWIGFFIFCRNERATIPWMLSGKPSTVGKGVSALPFMAKMATCPVVERTW
jgi:hypothetical protein